MADTPITVLIVDDSALMRQILTQMLDSDPFIHVVGAAPNPIIARQMIKDKNPDVITLDVEMPKMDGLTFLEKIMSLRPTPVVMVSSLTQEGAEATLHALEVGAVDFIGKPTGDLQSGMTAMAPVLREKVKAAARAQVRAYKPKKAPPQGREPLAFQSSEVLIAIGASTGGVEALGHVLSQLPPNCPAVVVTQHMPQHFTKSFANRLNNHCAMKVAEAEEGRRVVPGQIWIAPGHSHLLLKRSGADYVCRLSDAPPVSGHRPSADVMFESVAKAAGANAIGVILTGMGRDGADGLLKLRQAGGHTLGQDENSCLIYGMPKAAYEAGAVEKQADLKHISDEILKLVGGRKAQAVRI